MLLLRSSAEDFSKGNISLFSKIKSLTHTRTHAHARTHTHARMHARTHTHTEEIYLCNEYEIPT
jgi:hypothetical protein